MRLTIGIAHAGIGGSECEAFPAPAGSWITFRLCGETLCFPAQAVRGVMGASSLIPALNRNFGVVGFVISQGKTQPVMDIRPNLNLPCTDMASSGAIVLVSLASDTRFRAGIFVEQLEHTIQLPSGAFHQAAHASIPGHFLHGAADVRGSAVWALDLDFLLNPGNLKQVEPIAP